MQSFNLSVLKFGFRIWSKHLCGNIPVAESFFPSLWTEKLFKSTNWCKYKKRGSWEKLTGWTPFTQCSIFLNKATMRFCKAARPANKTDVIWNVNRFSQGNKVLENWRLYEARLKICGLDNCCWCTKSTWLNQVNLVWVIINWKKRKEENKDRSVARRFSREKVKKKLLFTFIKYKLCEGRPISTILVQD